MPVSEELRTVERQVDSAYRASPLLSRPRSQAMWYFLAECEEYFFRRHFCGEPLDAAYVDAVANLARWPLRWLWKDCDPQGACRPPNAPDNNYESAHELAELGRSYEWFEAAFTYASKCRISLELKGTRIIPGWDRADHVCYDAYDRLRDAAEKSAVADQATITSRIAELVRPIVQLQHNTFEYVLNPSLFKRVYETSKPLLKERFRLPGEWTLPTAMIAQYSIILKAIWVLSAIHVFARLATPNRGYNTPGYSCSVVMMTRDELITRLCRYVGLDRSTIRNVVGEITYGGQGINNPDIVLQPLVPLEPDCVGWSPSLVLHSSLERNLLVLLNRLPASRTRYSELSGQREKIMLDSLRRAFLPLGLRCWSGDVPGWEGARQVDLAIIDEQSRCCLVLEIKAFIAPADPREVLDRSVEIEKGVEQVARRRDALRRNRVSLNDVLSIDDSFAVHLAVVSESAVCCGMAHADDSPVVRSSHLIERIKSERDLCLVCDWLEQRRFLPTPGRDYEKMKYPVTIRDWTLEWYQIRPLTENYC